MKIRIAALWRGPQTRRSMVSAERTCTFTSFVVPARRNALCLSYRAILFRVICALKRPTPQRRTTADETAAWEAPPEQTRLIFNSAIPRLHRNRKDADCSIARQRPAPGMR